LKEFISGYSAGVKICTLFSIAAYNSGKNDPRIGCEIYSTDINLIIGGRDINFAR